jgi:hypothetical protein
MGPNNVFGPNSWQSHTPPGVGMGNGVKYN